MYCSVSAKIASRSLERKYKIRPVLLRLVKSNICKTVLREVPGIRATLQIICKF